MDKWKEYALVLLLAGIYLPLAAQDVSQNYVMHEFMLDTLGTNKNTTVTYMDGVGRPCREVTNSLGTNGKYVSTMTLYDACGRLSCDYFPAALGTSPIFLSESKFNSLSRNYHGDSSAYMGKTYDVLQRETSIFHGGDLWMKNNRNVIKEYGVNDGSVKRYIPSVLNGKLQVKGEYAPGTLHVETIKNEDGNVLVVYKNRLGQKLLERRASDVDTYFVYDDFGNLRFVLSPNYQDDEDLDASGYEYRYDGKGRCVWKRLPGAQYAQYWYDDNDRLIYEQDALLRAQNLVRFYLYDGLGRMAMQGVSSSCNLSCLDALVQMSATPAFLGTGYVLLSTGVNNGQLEAVNYYDSYMFLQLPCFSELNKHISGRGSLSNPVGLDTGSIIFTSQGSVLCQVRYYDKRGQIVNEYMAYPNQTVVSKSSKYSFTKQPLEENYVVKRGSRSLSYSVKNTYFPYNDKVKTVEMVTPLNVTKIRL